jgi:hypothetical protein
MSVDGVVSVVMLIMAVYLIVNTILLDRRISALEDYYDRKRRERESA